LRLKEAWYDLFGVLSGRMYLQSKDAWGGLAFGKPKTHSAV
jgi:hypothetical protein